MLFHASYIFLVLILDGVWVVFFFLLLLSSFDVLGHSGPSSDVSVLFLIAMGSGQMVYISSVLSPYIGSSGTCVLCFVVKMQSLLGLPHTNLLEHAGSFQRMPFGQTLSVLYLISKGF